MPALLLFIYIFISSCKPETPPIPGPNVGTASINGHFRLKATHKVSTPLVTQINSAQGWVPIFIKEIPLKKGDVIHLFTQNQVTIDSNQWIGNQMRLNINNTVVGMSSQQINVRDGSHHQVLWAQGYYQADRDQIVTVSTQVSAYGVNAAFPLKIDTDPNKAITYGQLLIEHYSQSTGQILDKIYVTKEHLITNCCIVPYKRETILKQLVEGQSEDTLFVTGAVQGISSNGFEMIVALLIYDDKTVISPYNGENVLDKHRHVPQHMKGYFKFTENGSHEVMMQLYGGFNRGAVLDAQKGELSIRQFSKDGRLFLKNIQEYRSDLTKIISNGGNNLLKKIVLDLKANDVIRAITQVKLHARQNNDCILSVEIVHGSESDSLKTLGGLSKQYFDLTLKVEKLIQVTKPGRYEISQYLSCQGSGTVKIAEDAPITAIEQYRE